MLHFQTIAELGAAYRRHELSPVDVTRAQLDRIAALADLHAYVCVLADSALAEARAAEAAFAAGWDRVPLLGVPVGVKDLLDIAGVVTAAGSTGFDYTPETSATLVRRLQHAGAVILGKQQMTEFAGIGRAGTDRHPNARNPWAADRTPGGSSSGTGVAVASGLGFAGIGSDTGGSIRTPAAYCGVVGLKPTYGLVPVIGSVTLAWSLDHLGPITRSVEDAGLVLAAIAGHDPLDPWSVRDSAGDVLRGLRRGVRGLRIGIPEELVTPELVDEPVGAAFEAAVTVFTDLGAEVVRFSEPAFLECETVDLAIIRMESAAYHDRWYGENPDRYHEKIRGTLEEARGRTAIEYLMAKTAQHRLRTTIDRLFDTYDLILTPSGPLPSLIQPVGTPTAYRALTWAAPANVAGIPAISVPAGFSTDGLPIGVTLAGRAFAEATVLRAAHAYEQATPWHDQHPVL